MKIILSPSILAADFNALGKQINMIEEAGVVICTLMLWTDITFPVSVLEHL